MNPEKRTLLPGIAFSSFASRYQEPTLAEGFQEIVKIPFEVGSFDAARTSRQAATPSGYKLYADTLSFAERQSNDAYGLNIGFDLPPNRRLIFSFPTHARF